MRRLLRAVASPILGPIEPYHVLRLDGVSRSIKSSDTPSVRRVTVQDIESSRIEEMRDQAWYCGAESASFAWTEDSEIVALCFYWWGDRYRKRNFWPLATGQAKLVQIIVASSHRGAGIARQLIEASAQQMLDDGFERLYARVWHSNRPSLTAFNAAGWSRVATVVRCTPRWRTHPLRFSWGQRPDGVDRPS